jgi:hypothetical protein
LVRLDLHFPRETASLWGQVVYGVAEMGFALRFVFGGEADQDLLRKLIDQIHRT